MLEDVVRKTIPARVTDHHSDRSGYLNAASPLMRREA